MQQPHSHWFPKEIIDIIPSVTKAFKPHGDIDQSLLARGIDKLLDEHLAKLDRFINSERFAALRAHDPEAIKEAISLAEKGLQIDRQEETIAGLVHDLSGQSPQDEIAKLGPFTDALETVLNQLAESAKTLPEEARFELCANDSALKAHIDALTHGKPTLNPNKSANASKLFRLFAEFNQSVQSAPSEDARHMAFAKGISNIILCRQKEIAAAGCKDGKDKFERDNKLPEGTLNALLAADGQPGASILDAAWSLVASYEKKKGPRIRYSWKEAKEIVTAAYMRFDPEFGQLVKRAFDNGWVLAQESKGTRYHTLTGLHASQTKQSFQAHPFVAVTFNGNVRDVTSLAHEMGHMIHYYYSRNHTDSIFSNLPGLLMDELLPHFSENLAKEEMLKRAKSPEQADVLRTQFALLTADKMSKLPEISYEDALHAACVQKGEQGLSYAELNALHSTHTPNFCRVACPNAHQDKRLINFIDTTPYHDAVYPLEYLMADAMMEAYRKDPDRVRQVVISGIKAGAKATAPQIWQDILGKHVKPDQSFFAERLQKLQEEVVEGTRLLEAMPSGPPAPHTGVITNDSPKTNPPHRGRR